MNRKSPRTVAPRHTARCTAIQVLYGLSFADASTHDELEKSYLDSSSAATEEESSGAETAAGTEPETGTEAGTETEAETEDSPVHVTGFAWELVEGVWTYRREIDALIGKYSQNWRLERIGHIELTILRLSIFEICFRKETSPKIIINEAIEFCSEFGVGQAVKFINGILDSASKDTGRQTARS